MPSRTLLFAGLVALAACGAEDLGLDSTASEISHASVSRLTAAATVTTSNGSGVAFPAQFQATRIIALYDSDHDGVIDPAPGDAAHTFPMAVATPFVAGRRIGSSLQVGFPPGPGFCGDIVVYAIDDSGPVAGDVYFVWFALRSPGYVAPAGCDPSNVDAGAGAFNLTANLHHETVIGGFAQGSQVTQFQWWLDLGAGTVAWPGRIMTTTSISSVVMNQITGTFSHRIELTGVTFDAPLIHETAWDGASTFGTGAAAAPSDHAQVTLAMHAGVFGADAEDPWMVHYADVSGDGRSDVCVVEEQQVVCAVMDSDRRLGAFRPWSESFGWRDLGGSPYWTTVQFPRLDRDARADICAYTRDGIRCARSTGTAFGAATLWSADLNEWNGWTTRGRYNTIRFPDVDGDGLADVCGRGARGIECAEGDGFAGFWGLFLGGARFSDARGFNAEDKWGTIRYAHLDNDGRIDVCARAADGIYCARSLGNGFEPDRRWHDNFRDNIGWNLDQHWRTIRLGDVNGDGRADLCGRGNAGVYCTISTGTQFLPGLNLVAPAFSDAGGWTDAKYYTTIHLLDIDGSGTKDVCGRGAAGVYCARATALTWSPWVSFGPAQLSITAFGDEPHRTPGDYGVGDHYSWWQTLRPAQVDEDRAEEICSVTPWGVECSR